MLVSNLVLHHICLKMGLNTGKDHSDRGKITVLSIQPTCDTGKYRVSGFISYQNPNNLEQLINRSFSIKI